MSDDMILTCYDCDQTYDLDVGHECTMCPDCEGSGIGEDGGAGADIYDVMFGEMVCRRCQGDGTVQR